jgi:HSP20 family protein
MPNIVRRNENQNVGTWDPFRLMREMMQWDPFRAFDEMGGGSTFSTFNPQFEVKENADGIYIHADLPGIDEKDLEISMTGNRLTISGKRESEQKEENTTYYTYERSYGTFSRSFTLPEGVDSEHVGAELKNGVLTLHLPKKPELKPRKISIKGIVDKVKGSLTAGDKPKA